MHLYIPVISSEYSPLLIKRYPNLFQIIVKALHTLHIWRALCKILFKFMTYVNCYAIKLLRYAIIYSVVVILTVFDTVRGHGLNFILESYEQR